MVKAQNTLLEFIGTASKDQIKHMLEQLRKDQAFTDLVQAIEISYL